MITAAQVKAARALLGWSQGELAEKTGLGIATIKRLELSTELRGAATTLWKVQTTLEEAGVEFLSAEMRVVRAFASDLVFACLCGQRKANQGPPPLRKVARSSIDSLGKARA